MLNPGRKAAAFYSVISLSSQNDANDFYHSGGDDTDMVETGIILAIGFALGYAARDALSRYRRAQRRRRSGEA